MGKIEVLKTVPIFSDLSDKDLKSVVKKMVSQKYKKGHVILEEDSFGDHCYFLTRGRVKITRVSSDEREVILALLGPGDFFGEMSLLDGEGRSANIVANEPAKMLTLSRSDFLACLESYPKIAIALLEELAVRLRKSDQQIESLSLSDSEQRIGITIIRLAEELGTIKQGHVNIQNLPYQQDIANMAGTSRETVSRTLKLLEDKAWVKRENRDLIIYNFDTFRQAFS